MSGKAFLVLSDGIVFEGKGFGHEGEALGEVVFNTSMTGYQEILTDPSYKGQIVTMTYSQIGNYGINQEDIESFHGPTVEGFVIKECIDFPSNWRSSLSLGAYLRENKIVCIEGVDTRALTRHLRDHGAQMGIISMIDPNPESLLEKVREHPGISACDLVKEVTTKKTFPWNDSVWNWQPSNKQVQSSRLGESLGETKFKIMKIRNSQLLNLLTSQLLKLRGGLLSTISVLS